MKTPSPTICPNCGHTAEAHYFDMDSDACGICDMCPGWFHNKSGRTTPAAETRPGICSNCGNRLTIDCHMYCGPAAGNPAQPSAALTAHGRTTPAADFDPSEVSLCPNCNSMTHTNGVGFCTKCGTNKVGDVRDIGPGVFGNGKNFAGDPVQPPAAEPTYTCGVCGFISNDESTTLQHIRDYRHADAQPPAAPDLPAWPEHPCMGCQGTEWVLNSLGSWECVNCSLPPRPNSGPGSLPTSPETGWRTGDDKSGPNMTNDCPECT